LDPRFLNYYNRELHHVREMGGEFAKEFPKIASRLGLSELECADPYVERLLEGFAFLAARVQLKVDDEFPRFTQHLLEMVYPHYLAPTPSMAVVQLQPDLTEGSLKEGFEVPRDTALRSQIGHGEQTAAEYRTAHDTTLWPVELIEAEYLAGKGAVSQLGVVSNTEFKAGIRIRLRSCAGLKFNQLGLDRLVLYLRGTGELAVQLYEQLIANTVGISVLPLGDPPLWSHYLDKRCVRQYGFDDEQALLPYTDRSFQGYRLLKEYSAFPERFLFVELNGLNAALNRCDDSQIDIVFLLDCVNKNLRDSIDASRFLLYCTPVINLFPKRAERIHLNDRAAEFHIVPDRARPMDYEIYSVTDVMGFGTAADEQQEFLPFYGAKDFVGKSASHAYYALHREQRVLSSKQKRLRPRSSYIGNEVFVSLVDRNEAPYNSTLKQLALKTLCTNRDLPLHMPVGSGKMDFSIQSGAPIDSIKCVAGPTKPRGSIAIGDTAWKLISHLSLNYLSIIDKDRQQGAAALRELLNLYGENSDDSIRKQIDGLLSVSSSRVVRRMNIPGPISFGRGLSITVDCDESAFEGSGVFLFGAVMERFFARYASINSFTETVISTVDRGEVMRWPIRIGKRHLL